MNKALLDTDIFSEILKKKNPHVAARAIEYLNQHAGFSISAPTLAEIITGYQQVQRSEQLERFRRSVAQVEVIPFGREEADMAGQILGDLIRSGQPIGAFDPMIAATAIVNGLTLVTGNTVHFERVQQLGYHLLLANWRTPS